MPYPTVMRWTGSDCGQIQPAAKQVTQQPTPKKEVPKTPPKNQNTARSNYGHAGRLAHIGGHLG